ncbi:MAG: DUF58 domain-containing protein [Ardenticatenaceae bacterium]|nr:DUF58 domain-containing protein [Anaerolineales bacterium]MCB8923888.1 DUF58 domain-containing protein [Ardenticatenaceae bacterium]MCB8990467.1 DUF58 domain-containing protein [Ardenticatenaceae bacterium]MCB9003481.1 DUF58 domain-containing protein [Ardenticatenaceae bacterium]
MHVPSTNLSDSAPGAQITLERRLPLIGLLLLAGTAVFFPHRVWNTLLIGFGGLFLIAYLWVRFLAVGLAAQRQLRFGWVAVGDLLEESFQIHNYSGIPALWVEVIDYSNVPGYTAAIVRSVGMNGRDQWRQRAVCQQRGKFHLGPWAIRTSDPFGLFTFTRHYPAGQEIIIHPPIHGQLPIPLPAGQSSGRARARQRAWQATVNAASVRHYHPQDPLAWIHWPTSARRDDLFVREFDLDAAGDVWILLDMQTAVQIGTGIDSTEEQAVLLAAALAARGLSQNRPMGVAGYGRLPQIVSPGRGEGQRWHILQALALVQADSETNLQRALQDLGQRARRGTAVIIITPSNEASWIPDLLALSQRGLQSHVILLDRPSFGGEGNSVGMRDAIHRFGIDCQIVRQGEIGTPLEEQAQRGFWRFIVTGTGKVVAVSSPQEQ